MAPQPTYCKPEINNFHTLRLLLKKKAELIKTEGSGKAAHEGGIMRQQKEGASKKKKSVSKVVGLSIPRHH